MSSAKVSVHDPKIMSAYINWTGRIRVLCGEVRAAGLYELSVSCLGSRHWLDDGSVVYYCHTWLRRLPVPCYTWRHTTGMHE